MKNLLNAAMTSVVMMIPNRIPDGEGGFITREWREDVEFKAAIAFDSSMTARAAEADGVTSLYTVTIPKNAMLEYGNVFKRLKDGKIFRVTSDGDDKETPPSASFQVRQVTAEEWRLT